jgi:DNA repair protein SbcD/Mre11
MSLSVFLASDFHLGMKFASYPEAVRERLVQERFACLERVVAAAAGCDLLVIAGDLFDSVRVAQRDVQRAARALAAFSGRLVAVLPGNHDYLAPGDAPWRGFREQAGDRVLLLDEPRPYPLEPFDIDACLYPGPCTAKYSDAPAVGWVTPAARAAGAQAPGARAPGARFHVGVAHGSVEGLTPDADGRYYPMKIEDLASRGMDLWLLGHTHVRFPAAPGAQDRVFNAGTPEPDGFDYRGRGEAWSLSLDDERRLSAAPVATGALRFVEEEAEVRSAADLEKAERAVTGPGAAATLLRLHLRGRAPAEVLASVGALRERLKQALLYSEVSDDGLREEFTAAGIDRDWPAGSFPHELLTRLVNERDEQGLAIAHALLEELRS